MLSELFFKNGFLLYIVGGYVRNALMDGCSTDVDLAGAATSDEVIGFLKSSEFTAAVVNKKLGTLLIKHKSGQNFEYTTFRSENYLKGGSHSPASVKFVTDIRVDAKRRDFTANAIYYDIKNKKIIDFYGGIEDIKNKVLRAVETPQFVFESDGLRILRFIRLAAELRFKPDPHTLEVAVKCKSQLKDISHERFKKEFLLIINADSKHINATQAQAHIKALELFNSFEIWLFVMPALKPYLKTLSNKSFVLFNKAPPSLRLPALLQDIFTALKIEPTRQIINLVAGHKGLMLNANEVDEISKILTAQNALTKYKDLRLFILEYAFVITKLIEFLKLSKTHAKLEEVYTNMKKEGAPFCLKDLKINGNDIKKHLPHIKFNNYAGILTKTLHYAVKYPQHNNKNALLEYVKTMNNE